MNFIDILCSKNENLIFMVVVVVLFFYLFHKINSKNKIENMSNTSNVDISSINTLTELARKLQEGGVTIPGNLTANGTITGNTITSQGDITGGNINSTGTITSGNIISNGTITGNNVTSNGTITGTEISRVGDDWFRINTHSDSSGQTALYGNLSIHDTRKGKGGLSVGNWASPGDGNITATGTITTNRLDVNFIDKKGPLHHATFHAGHFNPSSGVNLTCPDGKIMVGMKISHHAGGCGNLDRCFGIICK